MTLHRCRGSNRSLPVWTLRHTSQLLRPLSRADPRPTAASPAHPAPHVTFTASAAVTSTRSGAEALGIADAAAARAAIGADVPGRRTGADAIEARAAAADIHAIGACGAEVQATAARAATPSALARAAAANASKRAGVEAGATVPSVTQQVDTNPTAVGLPGRTRRRRRILPWTHKSDVGDVGTNTGKPDPVEAARGGILAAAAFRVASAWDAEGCADAAVAVGIAGLTAAAAASADARAL